MTWWVVILIILALVGPVAWLLPSSKQKGAINLRLEARRNGVAMQLTPVKWPYWVTPEPPSPCAHYYRERRKGNVDAWAYWQLTPGQWVNQWRELCEDQTLLKQLADLPADVYKVEADHQVVGLYWGERGDREALQRIADLLEARI